MIQDGVSLVRLATKECICAHAFAHSMLERVRTGYGVLSLDLKMQFCAMYSSKPIGKSHA